MSRKDYILIARAIREVRDNYQKPDDEDTRWAIDQIVGKLCTALKSDNHHFDREKFYSAAIG